MTSQSWKEVLDGWGSNSPVFNTVGLGLPWWFSGWDSMLSLPRVQDQSLGRELGAGKPNGTV